MAVAQDKLYWFQIESRSHACAELKRKNIERGTLKDTVVLEDGSIKRWQLTDLQDTDCETRNEMRNLREFQTTSRGEHCAGPGRD